MKFVRLILGIILHHFNKRFNKLNQNKNEKIANQINYSLRIKKLLL